MRDELLRRPVARGGSNIDTERMLAACEMWDLSREPRVNFFYTPVFVPMPPFNRENLSMPEVSGMEEGQSRPVQGEINPLDDVWC